MESKGQNGNGVRVIQKYALALVYDTGTHQVSIGGDTMPICLAQMILDEALRQLEITRRQQAAIALQQQLQENARVVSILGRGGRA